MPAILKNIQAAVRIGRYRVTDHADVAMMEDNLKLNEVVVLLNDGETIEFYPEDFPFPSCLIYGQNEKKEPIHSVWAYDEGKDMAILITVYRPDPNKWIDFRRRR